MSFVRIVDKIISPTKRNGYIVNQPTHLPICNSADKPGPPEKPLKPEGITKNSVTLSWRSPIDDGGSEITNYILEKREADRHSWSNVSRTIHGTRYNVTGLKDGTKYVFRVYAENKYGVSEPLEMKEPVLVKSPFGKIFDKIVVNFEFFLVMDIKERSYFSHAKC